MSRLQDDGKRSGIVEAAFRVFGELGFRATTMKRIADEAGIAAGSIYTYFRDKDDVFRTAVDEGWKDFLSAFNGVVSSERPLEERISALIDMGFEKLKENLPLLRGMLFESSQMPTFRDNLGSFCDYIVTLLEEGRKRGVLELDRAGAWRKLVRVVVYGAMFSLSISPDAETEAEISAVKAAVVGLVRERVIRERAK
jgi:AcrR family transcriptional regulator